MWSKIGYLADRRRERGSRKMSSVVFLVIGRLYSVRGPLIRDDETRISDLAHEAQAIAASQRGTWREVSSGSHPEVRRPLRPRPLYPQDLPKTNGCEFGCSVPQTALSICKSVYRDWRPGSVLRDPHVRQQFPGFLPFGQDSRQSDAGPSIRGHHRRGRSTRAVYQCRSPWRP